MWKDASMKTLSLDDKLKKIDNEGMRVGTNDRCVADQIKSDKEENVVTDAIQMREF